MPTIENRPMFRLSSSSSIMDYLKANELWASSTSSEVLKSNAIGQQPHTLWIGCADSRCSEHSLSNLQPGEIFTHRNIANILNNSADPSAKAIITYAVNSLKVSKILVVGHTKCGGVNACLSVHSEKDTDLPQQLENWLHPLIKLRLERAAELDKIQDPVAQNTALSKMNIKQQVNYLVNENEDVKDKVSNHQLEVYGMLYNVDSGLLELVE